MAYILASKSHKISDKQGTNDATPEIMKRDIVAFPVERKLGGRFQNTKLGEWVCPDPAQYIDGMNLYQFEMGGPTSYLDPLGLSGRGSGAMPPPWKSTIDGPLEGLDDFQSYHGGTAHLSDRLINDLRQYDFYQEILGSLRANINLTPCDGKTHSVSGSINEALTAPWQPVQAGGMKIQGLPGQWAREPHYSWDLNNTIGSIHLVEWTMIFVTEKDKCGKCTVKSATVHFHLHDTYAFTGNNNLLLSWIPGKGYEIDNTWDEDLMTPPLPPPPPPNPYQPLDPIYIGTL